MEVVENNLQKFYMIFVARYLSVIYEKGAVERKNPSAKLILSLDTEKFFP